MHLQPTSLPIIFNNIKIGHDFLIYEELIGWTKVDVQYENGDRPKYKFAL